MSADEIISGLLMRAHARIAAQAHGEEFVHHNIPAKCDYEMALQAVESAIKSVHFAEIRQFGQKDRKENANGD